jgi:hypothetical protein
MKKVSRNNMTTAEAREETEYLKSFTLAAPPPELRNAAETYVLMQIRFLKSEGYKAMAQEVIKHHYQKG